MKTSLRYHLGSGSVPCITLLPFSPFSVCLTVAEPSVCHTCTRHPSLHAGHCRSKQGAKRTRALFAFLTTLPSGRSQHLHIPQDLLPTSDMPTRPPGSFHRQLWLRHVLPLPPQATSDPLVTLCVHNNPFLVAAPQSVLPISPSWSL